MRRLPWLGGVLFILLLSQMGQARTVDTKAVSPPAEPTAAVLMEGRTGQVLWARNAHRRLSPASTTKILTVLVTLEKLPLDRVVTISRAAAETEGSSIWLEEGERRTVRELAYGALVCSGNDACVALAEASAGSEAAFARQLNKRARQLGAKDTEFDNSNGLPDPDHLTTAFDLAIIARAALANPVFARIARTKVENIPWPGKEWDRRLINHNKLLWRYAGADGVKTGYTRESKHCLVASATRNGRQLIVTVMRAPSAAAAYQKAQALLDYGFSHYTLVTPAATREIEVVGGDSKILLAVSRQDLAYAVPSEKADRVKLVYESRKTVGAPIARGQQLGWVRLYQQDRLLARAPLVAATAVKTKGILWSLAAFLIRLWSAEAAMVSR